ncbi:2OG-Fe(II) oxygenase [Congregibacter variabilis]|uniref:2OG-Fe(II) oxygenase n=1 Tax=Congregibacter variabilis TaxID=3081200 RepID=A0ABZ0I1V7_9GAMM|nr:2OG-Fe(II) oxygenase [Congregibacter sp. IMCC43200]
MPIGDSWLDWTRSQLKQGATVAEIRNQLKEKGFTDKDIKYAFKKVLPKNSYKSAMQSAGQIEQPEKINAGPDYQALAYPKLVRNAYGERVVPLNQTKLQLFTIPNFLNATQCDTLIKIIRENAYPSQVDGYERQSDMRSSRTCNLSVRDHPYIAEIDEAISQTLGISLGWSEINQGQWYEPGQQFKPHPDYFPPGTPEYTRFASIQGQRTWTFMIYLNHTEQGGGTHFTKINKTVMPEQGRAVCWNNLLKDGQPNLNSEHAGLPVEAGSKFILTKWFRDRGQGPAFVS